MSEVFLAPDANDEPTLWGRVASKPEEPEALLCRREISERWRDTVWNLLISGLVEKAQAHKGRTRRGNA